jgi:Sulfotransferase family
MTIVTQFLNHHDAIKIFDEIDLIQVGRHGESVIGTLQAFLVDRGAYDVYRHRARETADPAIALRSVIGEIAHPCTIWGEKNPRYATQLSALKRSFPEAVPLFVLRDPREVVNSCLAHRDSPLRTATDFWIMDTVGDALALVQRYLEPLDDGEAGLVVLRFEAFAARPRETLDAALGRWGLTFSDSALPIAHAAPETVGDHQFFREGAALPWKAGNLCPLRSTSSARDRADADDPVWAQVDALARRFGYE